MIRRVENWIGVSGRRLAAVLVLLAAFGGLVLWATTGFLLGVVGLAACVGTSGLCVTMGWVFAHLRPL